MEVEDELFGDGVNPIPEEELNPQELKKKN